MDGLLIGILLVMSIGLAINIVYDVKLRFSQRDWVRHIAGQKKKNNAVYLYIGCIDGSIKKVDMETMREVEFDLPPGKIVRVDISSFPSPI